MLSTPGTPPGCLGVSALVCGPQMAQILDSISRWCARITAFSVLILAVALVSCLLISIFFRYVVGQALSWPEELSMLLFTWLVLLTSTLGVREGFHVRLSIVFSRFPKPMQRWLWKLIVLGIAGFGAVLIYSGWDLMRRTAGNLSATIGYPLEAINLAAPVCGVLIVIHSLAVVSMPSMEE